MKTSVKFIAAAAIALGGTQARAQGIPVIDIANLVQTIMQVLNDYTDTANQIEQLTQLETQVRSITGSRNLGQILNNPALRNYIPPEAHAVLNTVTTAGYGGLTGTARQLRDAAMVYNCLDRQGTDRTTCQAGLAQPYQQKALLQDAMVAAGGRLRQINGLMDQINATDDQKAAQEIQARIGAESALLAHELSQIQMLQGMADSEERIARSRDRERQYQNLSRTGRIADFLR
ncbi:type IV secretion system protein [Piscinibacter sp. HJYY11]|uniref:type IV secretion system protein n=1 Tax=Piscinibacter sp. HJYY11 TaxID=2801333 RepID=UPI00191FF222|nr:type IV secretion system protein [Piscinibacter sp. HJYY11]MBL0726122.1 type IV secretion system protein [Piscinibacter sp. HJYY11]